ncbi:damage-inducible protein DinB [Aliishimia ponticola]|uniref:Damage-inducible protein DinB n=1 Tax=Aliishimia ponticola TaxID=2499833 RepID=A0A4S4NR39_9RHOB|nr:DinB family protein [Aliishimia ponticola]THH38680.1 damage-inducible protein DinB [Aliishimia ponticola]
MIDAEYTRIMARYNAWQNRQLSDIVHAMDEDALTQDRGAFFGSIFATLNHLLWADKLWMSRFDPSVEPPQVPAANHGNMTPTISVWGAERFHLDGKIRHWSMALRNLDLKGDLHWYSATADAQMSRPKAECIMHFFNHQTHHRGQIHAMLTAAGETAPVSDLVFLPEGF